MTPDLSDYERATVERIEAAEPAPESFDAVAALRRALGVCDRADAARLFPGLANTTSIRAAIDHPDYDENWVAS